MSNQQPAGLFNRLRTKKNDRNEKEPTITEEQLSD